MDCSILELFRADFSDLWGCRKVGQSLEVTTPFLLPDSTLMCLYLTEREGKFVVCDGGTIHEMIEEKCGLPASEIQVICDALKYRFGVKETPGIGGGPMFYKSSEEPHLITSISFDLANFAQALLSALVGKFDEASSSEVEARFATLATQYLTTALAGSGLEVSPRKEIKEIPGVRYSAVISSTSRLWLVDYVTGGDVYSFRGSAAVTAINFEEANRSSLNPVIARKIPLLNDNANGFKPAKLTPFLNRLREVSNDSVAYWKDKETLLEMIRN